MKLPHAARARVDLFKITDYLLCPDHPDGRHKAAFFLRFGFQQGCWDILARALEEHGATHEVVIRVESEYGERYVVEGPLSTPDGRNPIVRTVWLIENPAADPRLITAYPARRAR